MSRPLPGYLHVYPWRHLERVELKVPCDNHGYWHTFPLRAEYRAGTVVRCTFMYQGREELVIEVQAHEWDPAWESKWKSQLSPAYARFVHAVAA